MDYRHHFTNFEGQIEGIQMTSHEVTSDRSSSCNCDPSHRSFGADSCPLHDTVAVPTSARFRQSPRKLSDAQLLSVRFPVRKRCARIEAVDAAEENFFRILLVGG